MLHRTKRIRDCGKAALLCGNSWMDSPFGCRRIYWVKEKESNRNACVENANCAFTPARYNTYKENCNSWFHRVMFIFSGMRAFDLNKVARSRIYMSIFVWNMDLCGWIMFILFINGTHVLFCCYCVEFQCVFVREGWWLYSRIIVNMGLGV